MYPNCPKEYTDGVAFYYGCKGLTGRIGISTKAGETLDKLRNLGYDPATCTYDTMASTAPDIRYPIAYSDVPTQFSWQGIPVSQAEFNARQTLLVELAASDLPTLTIDFRNVEISKAPTVADAFKTIGITLPPALAPLGEMTQDKLQIMYAWQLQGYTYPIEHGVMSPTAKATSDALAADVVAYAMYRTFDWDAEAISKVTGLTVEQTQEILDRKWRTASDQLDKEATTDVPQGQTTVYGTQSISGKPPAEIPIIPIVVIGAIVAIGAISYILLAPKPKVTRIVRRVI